MEIGIVKGFGLFAGKDSNGWIVLIGPVIIEWTSKHVRNRQRIEEWTH